MSDGLVACVPNFSEGRDRALVHALIRAMRLPDVLLLDYRLDPDANRSTVTIAGPPTAVCEAAVRAAGLAVERIDLTRHIGRHVRMGAADVLPFAPLAGSTLMRCAALAREAADALWDRYRVPSYLYEAAAVRPDRVTLDEVRQGQFEGLREAVLRDPSRRPDVGGPGLHPSGGATAVGARKPLIEWRLRLGGGGLRAARTVAHDLRNGADHLPGVRALAFLRGDSPEVILQVADFRQTPLSGLQAEVERSLEKLGVALAGGECIGLLPQAALQGAGAIAMADCADHTIEHRLCHPVPWPDDSVTLVP